MSMASVLQCKGWSRRVVCSKTGLPSTIATRSVPGMVLRGLFPLVSVLIVELTPSLLSHHRRPLPSTQSGFPSLRSLVSTRSCLTCYCKPLLFSYCPLFTFEGGCRLSHAFQEHFCFVRDIDRYLHHYSFSPWLSR
ncbi:unnamed protein product [Laminaria digitata]